MNVSDLKVGVEYVDSTGQHVFFVQKLDNGGTEDVRYEFKFHGYELLMTAAQVGAIKPVPRQPLPDVKPGGIDPAGHRKL
jgi:hypothetical protein